jgi:hypothetical protein
LTALVGPSIQSTNKRLVIISTMSVVLVVAAVLGAVGAGWFTSPSKSSDVGYRPLRKSWLVDDGIRFTRLDSAQMSRVRITPADAARVVTAEYGLGHRSRVTFESLGGFVDTSEIIQDWVGTTSWIPKAVPAYFVIIKGVNRFPTVGPTQERLKYCDVIITASNATVVEDTCGL